MAGERDRAGIGEDWNEFRRLVAARAPAPVGRLVHSPYFTLAVVAYAIFGAVLILGLILA